MPPLKVDWCGRKISIIGVVKKETERDRCSPLRQASREREKLWMRGQMQAYYLAVVGPPN